jgi:hypothetical protein
MKKLVRLTAHTLRGSLGVELSGSDRAGEVGPVELLIDQQAVLSCDINPDQTLNNSADFSLSL